MNRSILQYARNLIRRRKFGTAIQLLQGSERDYQGSFEFYRMLGTCCLYVGDINGASHYYSLARTIKIQDVDLYIGQAAIFLHNGEIEKALPYYLDIEKLSPGNKVSTEALELLRNNSDRARSRTVISEWIQTGRIERLYPPIGSNPDIMKVAIFTGLLLGACISAGIVISWKRSTPKPAKTEKFVDQHVQNIKNLALTENELKNPSDSKLSSVEVQFFLSDDEINKASRNMEKYALEGRDNAALVEINRINNSNAVPSIKAKAESLKSNLFIKKVGFDNLKDNYSYEKVSDDPVLYSNCYVIWDGRITNIEKLENDFVKCLLLVDYVDRTSLKGTVTVEFDGAPPKPLDKDKPIRILGTVDYSTGTLKIKEKSMYQPLKDTDSLEALH